MPVTGLALAYYSAVLVVLGSCLLGWQVASQWLLHPRRPLPLAQYVFLIGLGAVGYLVALRVRYGWCGDLLLGVALIGLSLRMLRIPGLPALNRRLFRIFAIAGSIASLILPAAGLAAGVQRQHTRQRSELGEQSLFQSRIRADRTKMAETAAAIAAGADIRQILQSGDAGGLANLMQRQLVSYGLDMLVVTDPTGTVLSRPQRPQAVGDALQARLDWSAPLLQGKTVGGLATDELGQPVIVAGVPILSGGKLLGAVVAGISVDRQYLTAAVSGTQDSLGLYYGGRPLAVAARSAAEEKLMRLPALTSLGTASLTVKSDTAVYTAVSQSPESLLSAPAPYFLVLHHEDAR